MAYSENDCKEHGEVTKFRDRIAKEAGKIVFEIFPQKILELQAEMEKELFSITDLSTIHSDHKVPLALSLTVCNGPGAEAATPTRKKRRLDDEPLRVDGFKQPAQFTGIVPSNPTLVSMIAFLKPELVTLVDRCNMIKTWIQLQIPKIEDGNNFGVGIQEDILGEVSKCESDTGSYLEQISRYYSSRGKLVSKVAKYPALEDYHRSVDEYDEKVYISFKLMLREVRNIYAFLYDIILKNYKKLTRPRTSNTGSLY